MGNSLHRTRNGSAFSDWNVIGISTSASSVIPELEDLGASEAALALVGLYLAGPDMVSGFHIRSVCSRDYLPGEAEETSIWTWILSFFFVSVEGVGEMRTFYFLISPSTFWISFSAWVEVAGRGTFFVSSSFSSWISSVS